MTKDIHQTGGLDSKGKGRRDFLRTAGSVAAAAAVMPALAARAAPTNIMTNSGKPMHGLFPIATTPFTADDKLDLDLLQAEVKFCQRGQVPGFVWPQIASSWTTLSDDERISGTEAILSAAKGGKTAIVIGVQTNQWDVPGAVRYAKHAAAHGADAIISLPPQNGVGVKDEEIVAYYKAIGAATDLPLVLQTRGDMSPELVVRMANEIPTVRAAKDEVGDPLARVQTILAGTNGKIAVWSGNGVRTMMEEMPLGFTGHCPTTDLADLFQQAYELWHAGKVQAAYDMFGRIQAWGTITGAQGYTLVARGVFKDSTTRRAQANPAGAAPGTANPVAGGGRRREAMSDKQKAVVMKAMNDYLKPHFRA